MQPKTGAELIADLFSGYGVSHLFLVPSILNHSLYEMERRTEIKRIVAHGEKAAAYMADGYARASGRPGICMAQTVGAANLAAGLRDGYMACSPMIAITGGPYSSSRDRHQYQEVGDFPAFKTVTKFSTRVDDINMVGRTIRQAFRAATSDRPGPVYVEVEGHRGEVLETQLVVEEALVEERYVSVPAFRPAPAKQDVRQAAELLATAARPVLVAGGGARASGAGEVLLRLAEQLSIPIATSMNAKGMFSADHPLVVGVPGLYSRESANRVLAGADLVFFVGSKTGSQVTHSWQLPPSGTKVIQCDIVGVDMGLNYPNAASLLGDARTSIELLLEELAGQPCVDRHEWCAEVDRIDRTWRDEWTHLLTSDAVPIRPERLCAEISQHLPDDSILVADTGHAGMWTAGYVDLASPGQDFLRAAGTLGWAFPAALGAKCAKPNRPVVAFCGDGGFWYHIAELETAARCGINTITVVNKNNACNQEIGLMTTAYGGELHGRHGELWQFTDVDYAAVADSMGVAGFRVTKASEFAGALEQAVAANRPAVIEVTTELWARAPKAWTPA